MASACFLICSRSRSDQRGLRGVFFFMDSILAGGALVEGVDSRLQFVTSVEGFVYGSVARYLHVVGALKAVLSDSDVERTCVRGAEHVSILFHCILRFVRGSQDSAPNKSENPMVLVKLPLSTHTVCPAFRGRSSPSGLALGVHA